MTWEEYRDLVDAIQAKRQEYKQMGKENPDYKKVFEIMDAGLCIAISLIGEEYVKGVSE